jgi:hypothetical protein
MMLTPTEIADQVVRDLCADPDVWATHGLPSEAKMAKIRDRISRAIGGSRIDNSEPVRIRAGKPPVALPETKLDAAAEEAGLDHTDPQVVVAAAINDVIELARAMSPTSDFSRGAVEMRRRLAVLDRAIVLADAAGGLEQDGRAGSLQ